VGHHRAAVDEALGDTGRRIAGHGVETDANAGAGSRRGDPAREIRAVGQHHVAACLAHQRGGEAPGPFNWQAPYRPILPPGYWEYAKAYRDVDMCY
jgi:hypothetical protein